MFKEFKAFALKGNMVDMAVGIIIGAAFSKIVSSLVNDLIMPPIGLLMGNVDFSDLKLVLQHQTPAHPEVTLNYGLFINHTLDFMIVSFAIFMVVKQMNRLKSKEMPKPKTQKECPSCCSQIPLKAIRCPLCTSELPS